MSRTGWLKPLRRRWSTARFMARARYHYRRQRRRQGEAHRVKTQEKDVLRVRTTVGVLFDSPILYRRRSLLDTLLGRRR